MIYEFDPGDLTDKAKTSSLVSSMVYIALSLKGYGYRDDDIYDIISIMLNVDARPQDSTRKRLDEIVKGTYDMTEDGTAEQYIEMLTIIRNYDKGSNDT